MLTRKPRIDDVIQYLDDQGNWKDWGKVVHVDATLCSIEVPKRERTSRLKLETLTWELSSLSPACLLYSLSGLNLNPYFKIKEEPCDDS